MRAALRTRLLGVTAAGQKIHWLTRPQGNALPAVTLQTISGDRPQTHEGFQGWRETRVQLDAWGTDTVQTSTIVDIAIATLAPRETVGDTVFDRMGFEGERDTTERLGETTIYRTGIDLIVRHYPA